MQSGYIVGWRGRQPMTNVVEKENKYIEDLWLVGGDANQRQNL
jgi:hypothetical protein